MNKPEKILKHEFVEFIPSRMEENILYVSIPYATVSHKCCCGCGHEVVTPLSPKDWKIIFDGQTISLDPSIGNWSFECRSHYWIRKNCVVWAESWSKERIESARKYDYINRRQEPFKNAVTNPSNVQNQRLLEDQINKNKKNGKLVSIINRLWPFK